MIVTKLWTPLGNFLRTPLAVGIVRSKRVHLDGNRLTQNVDPVEKEFFLQSI